MHSDGASESEVAGGCDDLAIAGDEGRECELKEKDLGVIGTVAGIKKHAVEALVVVETELGIAEYPAWIGTVGGKDEWLECPGAISRNELSTGDKIVELNSYLALQGSAEEAMPGAEKIALGTGWAGLRH